jgi:hypothetical protein
MRLSLVTSLNWRIVSLWSWGLSVGQLIDNNVINTTAAERTILFYCFTRYLTRMFA